VYSNRRQREGRCRFHLVMSLAMSALINHRAHLRYRIPAAGRSYAASGITTMSSLGSSRNWWSQRPQDSPPTLPGRGCRLVFDHREIQAETSPFYNPECPPAPVVLPHEVNRLRAEDAHAIQLAARSGSSAQSASNLRRGHKSIAAALRL